jgi:hypothetical protein
LKHLNNQDKLSSWHAKWVAYVQQFSFTIKHKAGVLNKVADNLNQKLTLLVTMQNEVFGFEFIKDLLLTDHFYGPIVRDVTLRVRCDYGLYNGFLFKGISYAFPTVV